MPPILDWIEDARQHLYTNYSDRLNRLADPTDTVQTQVTLDFDAEGLAQGSVVGIGLEEMMVWNVQGGRTLDVTRGWNGSPKIAHPENEVVYVKPKFSGWRILRAINDTIRDLSSPLSGLFATEDVELTGTTEYSYALSVASPEMTGVVAVRKLDRFTQETPYIASWVFDRDHPVYAGPALTVWDVEPGDRVLVTVKRPFLTVAPGDNIEDSLLTETMWDLPPLGAAVRLVPPRDIKRTFTEGQPEPRRADEVPPGAARQAAAGPALLFEQRKLAEAMRLAAKFPYVMA